MAANLSVGDYIKTLREKYALFNRVYGVITSIEFLDKFIQYHSTGAGQTKKLSRLF